jgi:hypothetical protein
MSDTRPDSRSAGNIASQIRKHMGGMAYRGPDNQTRLPADLLSLLGCPSRSLGYSRDLVVPPVSLENNEIIGKTLIKIVTLLASNLGNPICSSASILAGLYRNRCWARCLLDEASAYALATVAFDFLEGYSPTSPLDTHVAHDVCTLLNEWVKPNPIWMEPPSKLDLTERLFGSAWCMVRLSTCNHATSGVIYQERPPFLPGLCRAQDGILSVPLPDDVGFS